MKRSEFVMLLARRLPFLFRQLISLSVQGYIPPIHRHRLFLKMAPQLFERSGITDLAQPLQASCSTGFDGYLPQPGSLPGPRATDTQSLFDVVAARIRGD